jgi:hypothetical protein
MAGYERWALDPEARGKDGADRRVHLGDRVGRS